MLTKQQLLAAANVEEVEIKGVPEKVRIRTSKHATVAQWMEDDDGDAAAIAASVVDADGNPMMTIEEAHELDCAVFRELVDATLRVNGYDPTELKNLLTLSKS